MKWLLLLLIPSISYAQTLKPGLYRDLKPDKPIVLDTGSYNFINLEMENLGKGIWLDGRKAHSIRLINCSFVSKGTGTVVWSANQLEIGLCRFYHLSQAIRYEAGSQNRVKIYRNEFSGNDTAISMATAPGFDTAKLELSLKCNEFINPIPTQGNSKKRIGLFLGKGVDVGFMEAGIFRHYTMGADGHYFADGFSYPNGNRWPGGIPDNPAILPESPIGLPLPDVHHPDNRFSLANSPNWIAIENQSGAPLRYYRYETEFVGWGKAIVGEVEWMVPDQRRKWVLEPGTSTDTCTYKIQQPKGQANLMVCEQLVDEQPFLLPTFWKFPDREAARISFPADTNKVFLSALPETGIKEKTATLQIWIPGNVKKAVLQYLDGGGQVLQNNPIGRRGWMEAQLDFNYTEPGVYGYRLLLDGMISETRKMVLNH